MDSILVHFLDYGTKLKKVFLGISDSTNDCLKRDAEPNFSHLGMKTKKPSLASARKA